MNKISAAMMMCFAASSAPTLAQKVLPFPEVPSASTVGTTIAESEHKKREVKSYLPEDAPNIMIIMLDDVGPGQASTYGGEINTPTLTKVANEGISFNRFHSTAMCSPTRAALLTGRNHHRVGNGVIAEFANDWDGYSGVIPKTSATMAEVLRQYGYATSAFGKWHNTPAAETSEVGPFDNWPTGYGFEHFYGFLGGEASHWEPALVHNTTMVDPSIVHEEGYHLSEDMAERAITWLHTQEALQPEKPFFMYWAPGAAHGPHHIQKEWADKYKGKFDGGWDEYRERVFERAKEIGWIPGDTELTARPETLAAWDDIPEEERDFQIRLMEVYAGFMEHADVQAGRVIDELEKMGKKDNTIIFYIFGDNGASAEGQNGSIAELLAQNAIQTTTKQQIEALEKIGGLDAIGSPKTENMMHAGWAWAGSTPYKSTKLIAGHFGGTRQPLAVSWPDGIKHDDTPRPQFHHVNDIAPTVYDILDIEAPLMVNGFAQDPIDGVSMVYTFDDAKAKGHKKTQYFEIMGSRGIYHDGWFAGTFSPRVPWLAGGVDISEWDPNQDKWELYNIEEDWSQANDLAAKYPEKLEEMKAIFLEEAKKNDVLPIGGSFWSTALINPQDAPVKDQSVWNFESPTIRIPEFAAPKIFTASYDATLKAKVTPKTNGVIFATGAYAGGVSFFVKDGHLNYEYNNFLMERTIISADKKLPQGDVEITVEARMVEPRPYAPMNIVLKVDGKEYASGRIPSTVPSMFSLNDGFDVGSDEASPVSNAYYQDFPFKFDGEFKNLTIQYVK